MHDNIGSDRCRQCGDPLERPLLVKGEPGTGKTELAARSRQALGLPI
jgi:MoxR-like ATPase